MPDKRRPSELSTREVREWVAALEADHGDDEGAHAEEDRIWQDVLEAIAAGASDPADLAAAALKTKEIEFSRWYA